MPSGRVFLESGVIIEIDDPPVSGLRKHRIKHVGPYIRHVYDLHRIAADPDLLPRYVSLSVEYVKTRKIISVDLIIQIHKSAFRVSFSNSMAWIYMPIPKRFIFGIGIHNSLGDFVRKIFQRAYRILVFHRRKQNRVIVGNRRHIAFQHTEYPKSVR